jgi:DNA-binding IclR family transcriptional regulator
MASIAPDVKPVPALVRAKRILDALAEDTRPRGISELARELSLPRSTVHGLCWTLVDMGLLERVNGSDFAIGPHALMWAQAFENQSSITRAFAAVADSMQLAETINLSVLSGRDVMYIGCRQGTDPLGVRFREGLTFPAAYTATGKAILSTIADADVSELFRDGWPAPVTPRSVADVDGLLSELRETRERAYSIDNGQLREAMTCCGAPVFSAGSGGVAVAGVAIALLSGSATDSAVARTGKLVSSFAAELSRRLGR